MFRYIELESNQNVLLHYSKEMLKDKSEPKDLVAREERKLLDLITSKYFQRPSLLKQYELVKELYEARKLKGESDASFMASSC